MILDQPTPEGKLLENYDSFLFKANFFTKTDTPIAIHLINFS